MSLKKTSALPWMAKAKSNTALVESDSELLFGRNRKMCEAVFPLSRSSSSDRKERTRKGPGSQALGVWFGSKQQLWNAGLCSMYVRKRIQRGKKGKYPALQMHHEEAAFRVETRRGRFETLWFEANVQGKRIFKYKRSRWSGTKVPKVIVKAEDSQWHSS